MTADAGGRQGRAGQPDAWGIVPRYEDAFGRPADVPPATVAALRRAMTGAADVPPPEPTTAPPTGSDEPVRAHLPGDLRTWGIAVQVYALHSAGSWGIGDLADLRELGVWAREQGAGMLLVNPVDAVAPTTPREPSPYYPASRRFRDWLHLRVEEVTGASQVADEVARQAERARAAAAGRIDRDAIAGAKLAALEAVWDATRPDRSDPAFREWRAAQGTALEHFATWSVLCERHGPDWRDWPGRLRRPEQAVHDSVRAEEPERVAFHAWLQHATEEQLAAAGSAIPLLRDLPVGFDPGGFDAWVWQDLLADGVTIGAPPDELGPQGQDWTLPAFVPWKLREVGHAPLVETLRAAFRHAGALRIDHVLGLFRQFWIPEGGAPADGAYVQLPAGELLDVVCRESRRAGAVVVGEDLGTVGAGVRATLEGRAILRYQVLWFEDEAPRHWSPRSLGSVSTHDLPTVAGVWSGVDRAELEELGLDPDPDWFADKRDRIHRAGAGAGADVWAASEAVHRALGRAASAIVVAQLDDLVAAPRRPNVPGTSVDARPDNWSLRLPLSLEELTEDVRVATVLGALRAGR